MRRTMLLLSALVLGLDPRIGGQREAGGLVDLAVGESIHVP